MYIAIKLEDNNSLALRKDLTGQTINSIYIIKDIGNDRVKCKCICGNIFECRRSNIVNGHTKSCGCLKHNKRYEKSLVGEHFGDWEVLDELGAGNVLCRCSCGATKIVRKQNLLNNISKSCGHSTTKFKEVNIGQIFGEWEVIDKAQDSKMVICKCSCGKVKILYKAQLICGITKSCGCKMVEHKRDTYKKIGYKTLSDDQLGYIESPDRLAEYIVDNFNKQPTMQELADSLNISYTYVRQLINKYDLYTYIDYKPNRSKQEDEIVKYIESICDYKVETNCRINGVELDIYIPYKKLAIEFNGNYWHSTLYRDRFFHANKSIICNKYGIYLIHIFEYEWDKHKDKLKAIIDDTLNDKVSEYEVEVVDVCDRLSINKLCSNNYINELIIKGGYKKVTVDYLKNRVNNEEYHLSDISEPTSIWYNQKIDKITNCNNIDIEKLNNIGIDTSSRDIEQIMLEQSCFRIYNRCNAVYNNITGGSYGSR